ncbi:hypothetical protein [Caulobacter sp. 602-1]|nr:hypothetical protein [Caulobacter sp. 602-1]
MTRDRQIKLIHLGSAKRLTRGSDQGVSLESADPTDRWMFHG